MICRKYTESYANIICSIYVYNFHPTFLFGAVFSTTTTTLTDDTTSNGMHWLTTTTTTATAIYQKTVCHVSGVWMLPVDWMSARRRRDGDANANSLSKSRMRCVSIAYGPKRKTDRRQELFIWIMCLFIVMIVLLSKCCFKIIKTLVTKKVLPQKKSCLL